MKLGVYAIYDEASEAFVQQTTCNNDKYAEMMFTKLFKDNRLNVPMLNDYPNVFKLYKLATFDDNTGLYENLPQHLFILDFGSINKFETNSVAN